MVRTAFDLLVGLLLGCAVIGAGVKLWTLFTRLVERAGRHRNPDDGKPPLVSLAVDDCILIRTVDEDHAYPTPAPLALPAAPVRSDPTVTSEFRLVADAALRAQATARRVSHR